MEANAFGVEQVNCHKDLKVVNFFCLFREAGLGMERSFEEKGKLVIWKYDDCQ